MPKITNARTKEGREIPEGSEIREACEELGVPFQCTNGICGTCMIDIKKGEENLTDLTEPEKDLERNKKHRLACQCKIKKDDVEFEF